MQVILHNIRSLHNVGSIFRTADGAGAEKIYLCGITPAPLDIFGKPRPQLTKVSLGAEKSVAWDESYRKKIGKLIDQLRKEGKTFLAVERHTKATPYYKFKISDFKKVVLILGHERRGIPPAILKKCDKILEIPMHGKKESLNVSVAFGVVAYSLRK